MGFTVWGTMTFMEEMEKCVHVFTITIDILFGGVKWGVGWCLSGLAHSDLVDGFIDERKESLVVVDERRPLPRSPFSC